MTHVNANTDISQTLKCSHVCRKKVIILRWSITDMFLFIKSSQHKGFAHETVQTACLGAIRCIYVFIYLYFLICSKQFLKKHKMGFVETEGLALNVAKKADWNDPKCQHAVTGSSQNDTERCNFIFCRFVEKDLFFLFPLHWFLQWPSQRHKFKLI